MMSAKGSSFDAIIIGAGICGLAIADRLRKQGQSFVILEKSRGIGGRIATRRVKTDQGQELTFDHGAQFFKLVNKTTVSQVSNASSVKLELLEQAKTSGVASLWFSQGESKYYSCSGGMTQLPKSLNPKDQILINHRVIRIERIRPDLENRQDYIEDDLSGRSDNGENQALASKWFVIVEVDESGSATAKIQQTSKERKLISLKAKKIFFTAPLPQSLQILKDSGLSYPSDLTEIKYAKALVGLFGLKVPERSASMDKNLLARWQHQLSLEPYRQDVGENIFSISDQKSKGTSHLPSVTVVMQPKFSEDNFDREESEVLDLITDALNAEANFELKKEDLVFMQLKKWRYSHPFKRYSSMALSLEGGSIVLAGDAFGGGSITGALDSAEAASKYC